MSLKEVVKVFLNILRFIKERSITIIGRLKMRNNIEKLYERIILNLNEDEKNHCGLYVYTVHGFTEYKKYHSKETLSLRLKIKENRKNILLQILENIDIEYKISNDNKYYMVIEINKEKNYIILDYVVNSHVIIPNSFLERFGYRTMDGMKVDYIDVNDISIKSKKTKEYKTEYGYYSKIIEDILNNNFETKIAMISKEINDFRNKKSKEVLFSKEKIEDIYNFFDVTTYRNVKFLNQVNQGSISSSIMGDYTHDQLMEFIFSNDVPHVYEGLKFNVIINKTKRDFIINDTMIASVICDNGNEIIIMPINKKECLALMTEEYYKKYIVNGKLYFMNIEDEKEVEMINRYIYRFAKMNKENVIGPKNELENLLKYVKEEGEK